MKMDYESHKILEAKKFYYDTYPDHHQYLTMTTCITVTKEDGKIVAVSDSGKFEFSNVSDMLKHYRGLSQID